MSAQCPNCGAVAGYGREPPHKSDCPILWAEHAVRLSERGGNPIVGHKTFDDGAGGFRHEPIRKNEADAIFAEIERADADRKAAMPAEKDALRVMMDAWIRLKDLGWREAIYCPKDGTKFHAIEAGSTGIFESWYEGTWPDGHWWCFDHGDIWPARPILFRPLPIPPSSEGE